MNLQQLFLTVADALDGDREIEIFARKELRENAAVAEFEGETQALPDPIIEVMSAENAHGACRVIAQTSLPWAPPQTSGSAEYVEHSRPKVHVELLGPDGLVKSNRVRMGLYGILPNSEYGIRTHPAEEIFVMLAGEAEWKYGDDDYNCLSVGERAFHPTMMPHATRTRDKAFMSVYVWHGDVSTQGYKYMGIPGV